MRISRRSPTVDWHSYDRAQIHAAKVLEEDRRPVEIGVIRFDKYGRRIEEIPSQRRATVEKYDYER
jgi:hypothetical protein